MSVSHLPGTVLYNSCIPSHKLVKFLATPCRKVTAPLSDDNPECPAETCKKVTSQQTHWCKELNYSSNMSKEHAQ
jgi:hypothetical protein